jgi:hypothetical protein
MTRPPGREWRPGFNSPPYASGRSDFEEIGDFRFRTDRALRSARPDDVLVAKPNDLLSVRNVPLVLRGARFQARDRKWSQVRRQGSPCRAGHHRGCSTRLPRDRQRESLDERSMTEVMIGMRNLAAVGSLVAVLLLPCQASAQVAQMAQMAQMPKAERPVPVLVLGGAGAAGAGMVALGFAGALIGANSCARAGDPDSCRGLEGALWGAAVGYTIGTPAGVHLANGRAGSWQPSLLTSAALAGVGAAIGIGSGSDQVLGAAALTVPIAQMVSSVVIERRTARRRPR